MWVAGGKGYAKGAKPLGWLVIRSAGFQQRNTCSAPEAELYNVDTDIFPSKCHCVNRG